MDQNKNTKGNFVWNMIGSIFESALSFVLLIAVNRIMGEISGGIFALAFSHAQLMYYVGTLEVRPIQSTDVYKKYTFSSYFSLRIISCILMIAVCIIYVLVIDADHIKKWVIFLVCMYKAIEAILDSFTAMYQQNDRIEYSGKISIIRVGLTLFGFVGVLLLSHRLEFACVAMLIMGMITLLSYNMSVFKRFPDATISLNFIYCKDIFVSCFPLFISVFVMLYISNAPKYAINKYCSDIIQNRYSILFMPAFAINLLSQFILRPALTSMSRLWNNGKMKQFVRYLVNILTSLFFITIIGLIGAWVVGIPILKYIYKVDLYQDKVVLLWVMVYGGFNAINILLYNMIAITRKQRWLLIGYIVAALVIFFLAPYMVQHNGMTGAIISSVISITVLDIILSIILFSVIRRQYNNMRYQVN